MVGRRVVPPTTPYSLVSSNRERFISIVLVQEDLGREAVSQLDTNKPSREGEARRQAVS